jgi:hypothetical protein
MDSGHLAKRTAASTRPVVDAIVHAVTSNFPKYRYTVGKEAKILYYLRLLRTFKKWEDILQEKLAL